MPMKVVRDHATGTGDDGAPSPQWWSLRCCRCHPAPAVASAATAAVATVAVMMTAVGGALVADSCCTVPCLDCILLGQCDRLEDGW